MNNKPIILATNIDTLEKGQKASDFEISVGVLPSDLKKTEPKLYAFRTGRIYDPATGFRPAMGSTGNVLPEKLHSAFYSLYNEAKSNLDKLKNEINTGENNTGNEGDTVQIDQLKTLVKSQEEQIKELLANKEQTEDMKKLKELLQAKTKEIEALKAGEKKTVKHAEFNTIVELVNEKIAPYLYGPAGTGKSEIAKQIAKHFKLNFYPMSTITQEFKFTGYQDGNGLYHDTNFYKAVKNGGIFFIDELDSCSSDVLIGLNACLANGYFDFPHETIDCHPDFRVISAGNTIGRGVQNGYVGRQPIDLSTMDRFMTVFIDYDLNIELSIAQDDTELVDFVHALRDASKNTDIMILISYRAISNIVKLLEKFELPKLLDMSIVKGMPKDDLRMLTRNVSLTGKNKYFDAFKKIA